MIKARRTVALALAIVICFTLFPVSTVYAEDSSSDSSITVSDGATSYSVTLSSYTHKRAPAGVYEATLPEDYTSATVTWPGCYVSCGCNKYEAEYEDGVGSLTVEPHKCLAPDAFGDFPENAVMLYLADENYDDWACLILYAGGDTSDSDVPITVSDGATSYSVTLSSYTHKRAPAGVYEATLPEDYTSATVTWPGCYVSCGCNKYEAEYEDGVGSLTVEPHKCLAPDAFGDFPENAVMLYLADENYDDWACLILYAGSGGDTPDEPKQKHALSATTSLIFSHLPDSVGNRKGTVTFQDADSTAITEALTGDPVTVGAEPRPSSSFEYRFAQWTTSDLSLTEEQRTSSTFAFAMPNADVNLHADFENVGTKVSWRAEPSTVVDIHFGIMNQYSPETFKTGLTQIATVANSDWVDRYEFLGWQVTCNGVDVSNDPNYVTLSDPLPGEPTYGRFKLLNLKISGKEMEIVANFKERHFTAVNVSVAEDCAGMGTATATLDTTTGTTLPAVFEGQTVTLTATPAARYKLDRWEVTAPDNTVITTTPDASDANKATFVMPTLAASGGTVTVEAHFVLDPSQASGEKTLSAALLAADGSSLGDKCTSSREGGLITLTLAPDVDTSDLASMLLKLTCSDRATVRRYGDDTDWPAAGKACNMTLGQEVKFVVTAENGDTAEYTIKIVQQKQLSSEKAITGVGLIYGGKTFATGKLTETETTSTWTVTLKDDIDQTLLGKIGTATDVFMKIDYTGASLAQYEGYDDAGFDDKWDSGKIMCGVSPGSQQTFTVKAEDGTTKDYTIAITQPNVSGEPVLSNGNATRTSDTAATVTFTSSAAGSYYYKVVTSGAAEPDIDTSKSGNAAVAGSNTITLNNLTTGARDIYIVVKNAAGDVSNKLKIAISAFGEDPDKPDEGNFTITYTGPTGGKLVPSRTRANAGDTITVTAVPDAGMQMVAGSMKYTLGVAGGESTLITDGTFTMPNADVTLSCKWEAVKTSTDGITGFVIDGVAGVVDNTTNTISVVMAYGTDVTKLIPIISGNNIVSISPVSGQMVDFTNSVRYTVTLTDGTVKYYTVTVYVQEGTAADKMWDKLTDFYDQTPWWEYADHQVSTGRYPKYW